MNRNLLLILGFAFFTFTVGAQSFDYNEDEPIYHFDLEAGVFQDVINHSRVFNLQPFTNNLFWYRNEIYLPQGWQSAVCDTIACYFPEVSEKPLTLQGLLSSNLDLHIYTNGVGVPGDSAIVELCVQVMNTPSTVQCSTYIFRTGGFSAVSDVDPSEVSLMLSPNPTANYFAVSSKEEIGDVDVFSIIGSKLKSFEARSTDQFDVSNLHQGMYLVRIYNKDNTKVLSTLRLNKR